ncbi:pyruvate phosphate dikinase [Mesotoga sp. Brook.08.YT.4.2.5.1]|uniref:pyruvate, phosphate dikinase n=1 Tax=unclassified Mesotoga TaxID=1184398 RepID=UPI000C186191|nr:MULTISPECIES: pyruvate, phosphate dikinase [unclassified Mesotoga]PNE22772.1 pyruvate phosphate dikinase [Mesotoga sp. Brook.08.YT.4.2.5.1]PNS42452.1 pyruvate phosphate dikinase [Mesotoga sp. B105.6.4]PVD17638.1 pyruvate phosphate dikinase [Mesotoga sp. Brook.08.105.5.1]RAO95931.1 pyruvate phosphate dikinase [Mesotoga sp. Brook.08.YT.4.2.5.4.]RDI94286.1 pyruvate phosphate dikinase [Mesotoga sp. Brook.08.YT.4.2.5.2.]
MSEKYVYYFGKLKAEGDAKMKNLLGGKGANLSEMVKIGIPVPPGFTISTEVCKYYYDHGKTYPVTLEKDVQEAVKLLEEETGKGFGSAERPLLVSVRSGAAISMPGMMDTILNLGLNDETVNGMIKESGNPRFCYDAYRRFLQMFGDVVLKIEHSEFENALASVKREKRVKLDTDLDAENMKDVVERYLEVYKRAGKEFPQDPWKQLWMAIDAVFGSWMNERAIKYRALNGVKEGELLGTAVNIVAMVFGNTGEDSGTGVAFTRDPNTGEKQFYGEYLPNAQGEDVVAGTRTPFSLTKLQEINPEVYDQLLEIFTKLENHYRDMQDIEFTVEHGTLYLLQTRNGKRTPYASVKIAVDLAEEKRISKEEAIMRVTPEHIETLLHPYFTKETMESAEVLAKGIAASPGAAAGIVAFDPDTAERLVREEGKTVILVRPETSPEDIAGMAAAQGILTSTGGKTSHAAVVARGMGKTCIVGCEAVEVDQKTRVMKVNGKTIREGEWISIDGTTGEVFMGKLDSIKPQGLEGPLAKLLGWADEIRKLGIRTNADTPKDSQVAREFGAEGIGLTRTEHMFFQEDRIFAVRQMITSNTKEQREKSLAKLLPMQEDDFYGIFMAMEGLPVTIRLLDPPLHEFLPKEEEDIKELAEEMGMTYQELKETIEDLHEFNPMMGFRGCRLAVVYPEIAEMQTKAIIGAALRLVEEGKSVIPEIMIPLIVELEELKYVKSIIVNAADEIISKSGLNLEYKVGTMIEVPRAALTADEIAKEAEFFSFGTNDLTQMTYGFSRDDYGKYVGHYMEKGILENDPFQKLDRVGVGQLVKMGTERGRSVRPDLKVGICGEHGGEPSSIEFCHIVGLNYVSCSPYRVPVARLAAAQAAVKNR